MDRLDPKRITDISKCLAICNVREGYVGVQCSRKPLRKKMCCSKHRLLDAELTDSEFVAMTEARKAMKRLRRRRTRER